MMQIASMGITHKKAFISDIEKMLLSSASVEDLAHTFAFFVYIKEYIALHTCNRLEIYVVTGKVKESLEFLRGIAKQMEIPLEVIEFRGHEESLIHLLRLASSIESMVIGEDQLLRQIKDLYGKAKGRGTVGGS